MPFCPGTFFNSNVKNLSCVCKLLFRLDLQVLTVKQTHL